MVSRLTLAAVIGLALAAPAAEAEPSADALESLEREQQRLFERVAPAVVFIANGDSFGSGFFVTPDGLVLTNAHVVKGATTVQLVSHDGRRFPGTVVERAAGDIDLALVQTAEKATPVLPMEGVDAIRVGSWVGAVGHGYGAIWTFNSGMISNIYPDGAERPVFQTQIPLNPGNSGGPIFDRQGRVIGVVTAALKNASAINFGIGLEVARRTLSRLAAKSECVVITAPDGVPVFVDGKMAGKGPRLVVPTAEGRVHQVFAVIDGKMHKQEVRFPATREVVLK